ncbi:MAG: hypothetical protein RBR53_05035 [Desulforegulaceae bacterium]|nr:hypothetical protein [Desulforegulaceae bacterium]
MIKTNYHIDTKFCNHAKGSIESFGLRPRDEKLLKTLFLDLLALFEKDFKNSTTIQKVFVYLYTIKKPGQKYKDKLIVKCDLETDFHPDYFNHTENICSIFDFDMIGSFVHFDLIYKFYENPSITNKTKEKTNKILGKMNQKKISMEINTSGFANPLKRQYPSKKLLKLCLKTRNQCNYWFKRSFIK